MDTDNDDTNGKLLARVDERTKLILGKLERIERLIDEHDRAIARLRESKGVWDKVLSALIAAGVSLGITFIKPQH